MDILRQPLTDLISRANQVRKDFAGSKLELCSILNAKSGLCSEDCKFCAQSRRHSTDIPIYRLKKKAEIIAAARNAKEIGAEKFGIVTSGNNLTKKELGEIIDAVAAIRTNVDIRVCASLGALGRDKLKALKDAGLSRYHHNIETSPAFYPKVVTTHAFQERIKSIEAAKAAGLEVCSGGIIGMGETWHDRIDMANILKDLGVDSVPINILVPIKGTPMEGAGTISCHDIVRTTAIFRIILKDKVIKIAAGREFILKDFQAMAFLAGANGMLIGGYLTIKGRNVEEDHKFVEEIKKLWEE